MFSKHRLHMGIVAILIVLLGCQAAKEEHYFKQGNNYYRLKVREIAFLTSSRYLAGYYDEYAVDSYFGEISQPDSTTIKQTVPSVKSVDKNGKVSDLDNKKLVLSLSTNSEAISNGISAIAESDETLSYLAKLANQDVLVKSEQVEKDITAIKSRNQQIIALGDQFIEAIQDTDSLDSKISRIDVFTKSLILIE